MKKLCAWPLRLLMVFATLFAVMQAHAQEDFLDPEKAFVLSAVMKTPDTFEVHFKVAKGYYLYRERLGFTVKPEGAATIGAPELPQGEVKYDPTFEKNMEVYHQDITVSVPVAPGGDAFTLDVAYQGCADAGLCYPPMTHHYALAPANEGWTIVAQGLDGGEMTPVRSSAVSGAAGTSSSTALNARGSGSGSAANSVDGKTSSGLSGLFSAGDLGLADAIGGLGAFKTAAVFFVLGILLALTPCVLPMIPILSAIVVRDGAGGKTSRLRGLTLAAAYVAGMSIVYTALGVAAGLSGVGLAAWLQKPWVLALFAGVLIVLALATFGAFTLQMPAAIQAKLSSRASRSGRGRVGSAAVMGAVSALIVGPCVAAPLAGALLYISQTGDVVLGAAALFAMAWGMGVPLLIVGASSTAWLPRTGPWMAGVNRLFGMLLLATAWFMLAPIVPASIAMLGWGSLAIVAGVMLFAVGNSGAGPVGTLRLFGRGIGVVLLLIGAAQVLGAASGGRDVLSPLGHWAAPVASVSGSAGASGSAAPGTDAATGAASTRSAGATGVAFQRVRSIAELDAAIAASTKPVMLDFYADWCVSCHEMERFTFTDPVVAERMSRMTLLQADVTANNTDDRALLKRFRLFGPPGIMFFDDQGQVRDTPRVIGFQNATKFAESLQQALTQ